MNKSSYLDWRLVLISILLATTIGIVVYIAPSTEFSGVLAFVATLLSIIVTSYVERWKQKSLYRLDNYKYNLDIVEKHTLGMWESLEALLHTFEREDRIEKASAAMKEEFIKKEVFLEQDKIEEIFQEPGKTLSEETKTKLLNQMVTMELKRDRLRSLKKAREQIDNIRDVKFLELSVNGPKFKAALDVINDEKLSQLYGELASMASLETDPNLLEDLEMAEKLEKTSQIYRSIFKRLAELRSSAL